MPDTSETLQLRPFRLSDAAVVGPWLVGPGLSLPQGTQRDQWPERLLRDQRIVAMVAHERGVSIGLVRLDCGPDGVADVTIVVAPEHRRRGQGRRMFDAALQRAREVGMRRLVAYVDFANEAALQFFGDCGFDAQGVHGSRIRLDRLVHAGDAMPPLDVGA